MKISERQAAFLKALSTVFPDEVEITTRAVNHRLVGLALKEPGNAELLQAAIGCLGRIVNAQKIGRLVEKIRGRRFGDLELVCADAEKTGGRWRYYVKDHSVEGMPCPHRPEDFGIRKEATSFKQLDKFERDKAKLLKNIAFEEEEFAKRTAAEAARQAAKAAEAEQARRDAEGEPSRLFTRYMVSAFVALDMVKIVHLPERGVEARLNGDPLGNNKGVTIFLRGPWAQRKRAYYALCELWWRKGWCNLGEMPFDGVTPELLHGKEIPPTASKDPKHYNTAEATVRIANQLAAAGWSSTERPLEQEIMRRRRFASWGAGLGSSPHRLRGMHCDFGAAIQMQSSTRDFLEPAQTRIPLRQIKRG